MKPINMIQYHPAPIKGGYTDRILNVNLTTRELSIQALPFEFKEKYIGGRGYALKFIWDGTSSETRYDSPENILVMASGPLCGDARFPGSGKFIVGTISPLTDTFIDSNVGGHFAPLLKFCGFDGLVVAGRSEEELVLFVDGDRGEISLANAPHYEGLSGSGALAFGEGLMKDYNGGNLNENLAAVTSGIGAENTRFGIINSLFYDKRRHRVRSKQAGRGGTGTVMRHKGLKAVIVHSSMSRIHGNNPVDTKGVKTAGADLKKIVSRMDPQQLRLASWGTSVLIEYMNQFHILPVQNYQYGQSKEAEAVFSDVFLKRYFENRIPDGCYLGCNLACSKGAESVRLTRGPDRPRCGSGRPGV